MKSLTITAIETGYILTTLDCYGIVEQRHYNSWKELMEWTKIFRPHCAQAENRLEPVEGIPDPALMAAVKDLMELMSHGYVPPAWWTVVLEIKSMLPPDAGEEG